MNDPLSCPHRRLKVCHIAATTEGAGWVFEQLRELRDRHGFEVSAILNGAGGTLVDRMHAAGITVHASDFDFTSNADLLALPRKVLSLYRLLRRERFDIIQTHLFHSMVIGRMAAWFADVPVRLSMIAGPFHLEAYTPRWIDRLTCWTETTTIASCEFTRTLYLRMGVPPRRLAVIYYGPDETRFDPSTTTPAPLHAEFGFPPAAPLIGMVAYFYPELPHNRWMPPAVQGRSVKSQEDLIRAAPLVLRDFPQAKFLLIGSGWEAGGEAYMRRMRDLVAELGLGDSVIFTGFRTDVAAVLRGLDVAVQPSLSENLGGTIESLLMQCPTVATRVGGMTDSVIDGETGVLVEPSNPRSLADGIVRLLRDPTSARRYGVAGRQRMLAAFTLRRTATALADLYNRLATRRPRGYRPLVAGLNFVVGSLLCGMFVLRYALLDAWLLRHWDQGWRPWRSNALSIFPTLHGVAYGSAARLNGMLRGRHSVVSGARPPPDRPSAAPAGTFATYLKHVTLYRAYAFIGRHAPGFGLGKRLRRIIDLVRNRSRGRRGYDS